MKKALIIALYFLSIWAISLMPAYRQWIDQRIGPYIKELKLQFRQLDPEQRKLLKYGENYRHNLRIKNYFDALGMENPVLFLPPKAYLAKSREAYDYGETLSFYYFTGVKPVDLRSEDRHLATHAIIATSTDMKIIELTGTALREQIIEEYEKYSD